MEMYVSAGDLISEIVKTDITVASVIINVLFCLRDRTEQQVYHNAVDLRQRFGIDKFSRQYLIIDYSCEVNRF